MAEIHLELLIGRRVVDANGNTVGHIEEIVARRTRNECVIEEFHTGSGSGLERLLGHALGFRWAHKPHVIKWDQLDLTDPLHPRLVGPRP